MAIKAKALLPAQRRQDRAEAHAIEEAELLPSRTSGELSQERLMPAKAAIGRQAR
jgi:hypothetical protein